MSALPDGLDLLLRIAVEDPSAEERAAELTGRPKEITHRAACFYIEQICVLAQMQIATVFSGPTEMQRLGNFVFTWRCC